VKFEIVEGVGLHIIQRARFFLVESQGVGCLKLSPQRRTVIAQNERNSDDTPLLFTVALACKHCQQTERSKAQPNTCKRRADETCKCGNFNVLQFNYIQSIANYLVHPTGVPMKQE
jgi:hypothetical protein